MYYKVKISYIKVCNNVAIANSADPDQTASKEQSDLGLYQGGHPRSDTKFPDFSLTNFYFSLTKMLFNTTFSHLAAGK